MSDQDKDLEQEIIEKEQTDDAPDTNKDEKDGYEDICYICRRLEISIRQTWDLGICQISA